MDARGRPKDSLYGELALKRVIFRAVDEGYDSVAWTPGWVQNERYGLSEQIDKVEVREMPDGEREVTTSKEGTQVATAVLDKDGKIIAFGALDMREQDVQGKHISTLLGKDMAGKIMALKRKTRVTSLKKDDLKIEKTDDGRWAVTKKGLVVRPGLYHSTRKDAEEQRKDIRDMAPDFEGLLRMMKPLMGEFTDQDLEVGGQGMRQFYDESIVNLANKIGKAFGAKVDTVDLSIEGKGGGPWVVVVGGFDHGFYGDRQEAELAAEGLREQGALDVTVGQDDPPRDTVNVHNLDIPPKMAEKVKSEGFSRFSIAPQVHSDLSLPELLTGWVIAPTRDATRTSGVTREELADRIMNDPEARKRSREVLDKITDKDVLPLFRIIIQRVDVEVEGLSPLRDEGLVSASLTSEMLFKNTKFFTTGKMAPGDKASLVRYDVPKDKIIAFLPALKKGISPKSNDKLKAKRIGQVSIPGFSGIRNPSAYAKNLLRDQQEILADVTGLKGKFLEDLPGMVFRPFTGEDSFWVMGEGYTSESRKYRSQNLLYRPEAISQGFINTPEEYAAAQSGNATTLNPFDLKVGEPKGITLEEFQARETVANQQIIDNALEFVEGAVRQVDVKYSVAPANPLRPSATSGYHHLTGGDKKIWDSARKWLKKQFTSGGLLPALGVDPKFERDNNFNLIEVDMPMFIAELERALKTSFGTHWSGLSDGHKKQVNDLIAGDTNSTLPAPVKRAVMAMRQYIDKGSGDYALILEQQMLAAEEEARRTGNPKKIAEASARRNLMKIITANVGQYVHRSYRVFDDPQWNTKITPEVYERAAAYLRRQEGMNTEEDVQRTIYDIVQRGTAYANMEAFIKESILGAKDLTALMTRNNELALEIRELMGEYDDVRVNFSKSATKIGRLIWNQRFLDRILEVGEGVFLFREGTQPADATETISASGSDAMAPLAGMRVTPEIKQAFIDALDKSDAHNWERQIFAWNGAIKYGKTILSPSTQFRNVVSAYMFTVANGHFDMSHMNMAKNVMLDYIQTKPGGTREYYRELVRLGVLYNNPQARTLIDLLGDARENQFMDKFFSGEGSIKKMIREGASFFQRLYMAGDDFWKIIGYENELAMYIKAKGGITENSSQAEKDAARAKFAPVVAKRIRDTYPTYSLVGSLIKKLRKFPLAGTFVSFPSEIIRTNINIIKLIREDLADPDLRSNAKRRMVGMAIAHSWAAATAAITASFFGLGDDEEEALRLMGSPWTENSSFLFWGRDNKGNLRIQDLSYTDPYNLLHRPFTAFFRDQPWEDKVTSAMKDFAAPFIGIDIGAGALYEVVRNKKLSGGRVYNPAEPPLEQLTAISAHIGAQLAPGAVLQSTRMFKAIEGLKSPSGRVYNVNDEALALVGLRISTFDPQMSLYYRTFEFSDGLSNARRILTDAAKDVNIVSDDDLRYAFNLANTARLEVYDKMLRFVKGGKDSGLSDGKIRSILRASGVSIKYTNNLVRGKEAPKWRIGNTFLKGAVKRAKILIDRETARELTRRKRFIRSEARVLQ